MSQVPPLTQSHASFQGKPQKLPAQSLGLGLRRGFIEDLTDYLNQHPQALHFLEVAPENWINVGGRFAKQLRHLSEQYPLTLHGLSLNIGGAAPLDLDLVQAIKTFIQNHQCPLYSEHLSYCADHGQLYDLMPIPFSQAAIDHCAARIQQVQDILGQQICIENVSYYAAPFQEMAEIDFINAVLEKADCKLLLDVNNIYVNSINHGYDAEDFLHALPAQRVDYMHIAGHFVEAEDLRVDTHGAPVCDPVWSLLDKAYEHVGLKPTLLERDFNFPAMPDLFNELDLIAAAQGHYAKALAV